MRSPARAGSGCGTWWVLGWLPRGPGGRGSTTRCAPTADTRRCWAASWRQRSRYFGFLSFFPLLALAFAVVGYVSGAFPDAQDAVTRAVEDSFPSLIGSGPGHINIQDVIDAKAGAGVIGLVGLFYAGLGWLDALRAALRRVFGTSDLPLGFVKKKAVDVAVLVGLGLAILASLAREHSRNGGHQSGARGGERRRLRRRGRAAQGAVGGAGPARRHGAVRDPALAALRCPPAVAPGAARRPSWARSASSCSSSWVTFLIVRTTENPVYATFGVIVGLLIWINLVSQLLMFVAAWAATAPRRRHPAVELAGRSRVDLRPLRFARVPT